MDYRELVKLALKRDPGELLPIEFEEPSDIIVGLGESPDTVRSMKDSRYQTLALPEWDFRWQHKLPFEDDSVKAYHAYHFLEHLSGAEALKLLREVERTLRPGGVFQFGMPLAGTVLSFLDVTHQSFWNEKTFESLFHVSPIEYGYNPEGTEIKPWSIKVRAQVIVGTVQRHLMLVGQLQKDG